MCYFHFTIYSEHFPMQMNETSYYINEIGSEDEMLVTRVMCKSKEHRNIEVKW